MVDALEAPPLDHPPIEPRPAPAERVIDFLRRNASWWTAAAVFAMSRLAVLLTAQAVTWARPDYSVTQLLSAWDGGWYLLIAADGYPDYLLAEPGSAGNRWAFYPGLPGLTRATQEVTGLSLAISGILVATIGGLLAAVAIWLLVEERLGRDAALTATALVCFFPSAYVLGMVYSESLFLLGAAVCLRTIGHRQWLAAGLTASATCLVRATGVALVAAIVVAAGIVMYRERIWRPLVGIVIAPLGFLAWAMVQWAAVGTPTAYIDGQKVWGHEFVWFKTPFVSLWRVLTDRAAWSSAPDVMATGALIFVAASTVLAVRYARRNPGVVPVEWWVYSAGALLFAFSPYWASSILRYVILGFPLFAVAGKGLPRWLTTSGIALSATVMGTLGFAAFLGAITWQTAPFAP